MILVWTVDSVESCMASRVKDVNERPAVGRWLSLSGKVHIWSRYDLELLISDRVNIFQQFALT